MQLFRKAFLIQSCSLPSTLRWMAKTYDGAEDTGWLDFIPMLCYGKFVNRSNYPEEKELCLGEVLILA